MLEPRLLAPMMAKVLVQITLPGKKYVFIYYILKGHWALSAWINKLKLQMSYKYVVVSKVIVILDSYASNS